MTIVDDAKAPRLGHLTEEIVALGEAVETLLREINMLEQGTLEGLLRKEVTTACDPEQPDPEQPRVPLADDVRHERYRIASARDQLASIRLRLEI